MPTIPELLQANLHRVFGERDAARRRAAIDDVYSEDVVFTDPEGSVTGRDALAAKAEALLAGAPDTFSFREDGPAYVGADSGALAWTLGPEGAPVDSARPPARPPMMRKRKTRRRTNPLRQATAKSAGRGRPRGFAPTNPPPNKPRAMDPRRTMTR